MEKQGDLLVSVSGIRGIVPTSLDGFMMLKLGLAYGTYLWKRYEERKNKTGSMFQGPPHIVIGKDARATSSMMHNIITGALQSQGFRIHNLGIVPTPTLKAAISHFKADGGVMVTASHNPIEWNGLKLFNENSLYLSEEEIAEVHRYAEEGSFIEKPATDYGTVKKTEDWIRHVKEVIGKNKDTSVIRKRKLKVAIDCCGSCGYQIIPNLLRKLNCRPVRVFCKPMRLFPRGPLPSQENLERLVEAVKNNHCDIGFAVDPDADRLAVVDEFGEVLSEEYTLALALMHALTFLQGDVVVNYSTSLLIDHICEKNNRKVIRTKVGEYHVVKKIKEIRAAFGGEGNGGVIDPRISSIGRDSLAGIIHILALIAKTKQPISQIVASLPKYRIVKKTLPLDRVHLPKIEKKILEALGEPDLIEKEDGLYMRYKDYWIHVRQSNTEKLYRLIYEYLDPQRGKQIESIVQKFVED